MTRYLNKIYLDSLKNGVAESVNSALWLKGNKFASEVLRHLLCVYRQEDLRGFHCDNRKDPLLFSASVDPGSSKGLVSGSNMLL